MSKIIRIGTRGSRLAVIQAELVASALRRITSEGSVELVSIETQGDRKQGITAAILGEKKDWIYELELALLAGQIDLAVHSGKDVPLDIESGTEILPVLGRASPFDAFVGQRLSDGTRLKFTDVPPGATVGTASLRRKAFLHRIRPDLSIVEHRGNVTTRLDKLESTADLSGIVLAAAGMARLGLGDFEELSWTQMVPALNQGLLVAQLPTDDADLGRALEVITPQDSRTAYRAERSCARVIGGDCHSAIGIYAWREDKVLRICGEVLAVDGSISVGVTLSGTPDDPETLGLRLGNLLLERGAGALLRASDNTEAEF